MHKLDSSVILKLLREERSKQLDVLRQETAHRGLAEDVEVTMNVAGVMKKVVTPGLKLRSKNGGKLYTVNAVSATSVVLLDPVGQTLVVSDRELESGFDLD
jgi:hypothetical protein